MIGVNGGYTLPSTWSWATIADLSEGVFDCPHSTPKLEVDGPYVVRTQDIASGVFRAEKAARVSAETYRARVARAEPRYGDLLYSREGAYFGVAAEVPRDTQVCLGQRMVLIRPRERDLDHRYLKYWMNSEHGRAYAQSHREGSAAPRINLPSIRAFPVPLAPRDAQRAIATTLGCLDDKIESNRRAAELCMSIAAANFDLISADCDSAVLDDLATLVLGGTPDRTQTDFWQSGTIPWINSGSANQDIVLEPTEYITTAGLAGSAAKVMPVGATVVAITGATLGQVALLGIATSGNQSLVGAWADSPGLTGWLHFAIRSSIPTLIGAATGAAQQHVNKGNLAALRVASPDSESLAEWSSLSLPLMDRAVSLGRESLIMNNLRNALLPELLSGRLRVGEVQNVMQEVLA